MVLCFSVFFLVFQVSGSSSLVLVLGPIWAPVELFLRWVPRVVPVLCEPGAVGHAHGALPSRLRPGGENISSSLLLVLLEPICTFSDAKRANGSTAKGASRKGAVPAHLPRLRASLCGLIEKKLPADANGTGELWGVCRNGFFSQLPIDF